MLCKMAKIAFATLMIGFCGIAQAQSPATVLVVANQNNANSMALAQYYMNARRIPTTNLVLLNWRAEDWADTCDTNTYLKNIAKPVYDKIATLAQIDYIVLCRNLPSKITGSFYAGTASVDSCLMANSLTQGRNPYFMAKDTFSSAKYGIRLVTRLDAWSWDTAFALVDRSLKATRGMFFLEPDSWRNKGDWVNCQMMMSPPQLKVLGATAVLNSTGKFDGPSGPVVGYYSWGSNDSQFDKTVFAGIQFVPGGIAETCVSTSGMNIRGNGASKAQSQIAQLLEQGATGGKGYVSEPYLDAVAMPQLLFARYAAGYNLAESYFGASQFMGWKDVVIGDPLCRPYTRKALPKNIQ